MNIYSVAYSMKGKHLLRTQQSIYIDTRPRRVFVGALSIAAPVLLETATKSYHNEKSHSLENMNEDYFLHACPVSYLSIQNITVNRLKNAK